MKSTLHFTLLLSGIMGMLLFSCHDQGDHNHDHDHDHEAQNDHEELPEGFLILNAAQFQHAGIDTGDWALKNISEVVKATGYTRLPPQNMADVSLPVGGIIQDILVIEGDHVKKGQTLAHILSMDYQQLLSDKSELEEALALAEAERKFLQKEHDRQQILAVESVNARKLFEKAQSDLERQDARIQSVRRRMSLLDKTLGLLGYADGPLIPVKAPISGYVREVMVHIGSAVAGGQQMFALIDNSKIHADLMVYEKDLPSIKVGQEVRFSLTNQTGREKMEGKVYNISQAFTDATKTVSVHVHIHGKGHQLLPDMFINALIEVGQQKSPTLPEEAIVMAEGRNFIFALADIHEHDGEKEYTFRRLEVKRGKAQLGDVEITLLETKKPQESIVTRGAYYLQSHLLKSEGGGGHEH